MNPPCGVSPVLPFGGWFPPFLCPPLLPPPKPRGRYWTSPFPLGIEWDTGNEALGLGGTVGMKGTGNGCGDKGHTKREWGRKLGMMGGH